MHAICKALPVAWGPIQFPASFDLYSKLMLVRCRAAEVAATQRRQMLQAALPQSMKTSEVEREASVDKPWLIAEASYAVSPACRSPLLTFLHCIICCSKQHVATCLKWLREP